MHECVTVRVHPRLLLAISLALIGSCGYQESSLTKRLVDASALGDSLAVTKMLVEGADPNAQDGKEGWTPLVAASTRCNEGTVLILLASKADVNRRAVPGTALYAASLAGHASCVRLLLEFGGELQIDNAQAEGLKRQLQEQKQIEIEKMLSKQLK
jgi:uncharacterized protein